MTTASKIDEMALLKELGLADKFKSLADLKKFTADAETAMKERDGYKTRFSTYGKTASEAGFKSLEEVFKAAAEARKPKETNNAGWRDKIGKRYQETYGQADYEKLMKEEPRLLDFWDRLIQDVVASIPSDKFLTQEHLDKYSETIGDHLAERDFLYNLSPEDRAKVKPFLKDIRNIYAEERLYDPPVGADDSYDPFAEAWKRHQAKMEKAGVKMTSEETKRPDEPARRIAFPGGAVQSSAADGDNRPGPGFDEKRFRSENPELFHENGEFKWEDGFALGAGG